MRSLGGAARPGASLQGATELGHKPGRRGVTAQRLIDLRGNHARKVSRHGAMPYVAPRERKIRIVAKPFADRPRRHAGGHADRLDVTVASGGPGRFQNRPLAPIGLPRDRRCLAGLRHDAPKLMREGGTLTGDDGWGSRH